MKEASTITVALMKDRTTPTWLAQIHVEYKGGGKDVLPMSGNDPVSLLHRCVSSLDKRLKTVNGKTSIR